MKRVRLLDLASKGTTPDWIHGWVGLQVTVRLSLALLPLAFLYKELVLLITEAYTVVCILYDWYKLVDIHHCRRFVTRSWDTSNTKSVRIYVYMAYNSLTQDPATYSIKFWSGAERDYDVCGDKTDRLSGLVVRVSGYRYRGPGSIPGATRFSE